MRFGNLKIDPARNPAVLDTVTWDRASVQEILQVMPTDVWRIFWRTAREGVAQLPTERVCVHPSSCVRWKDSLFCLTALFDGQLLWLECGSGVGVDLLDVPVWSTALGNLPAEVVSAYAVDLAGTARFLAAAAPNRAPRALGAVPRLGIGSRMTTASWPGVFRAMAERGFASNAIQNSVREANVLEDILAGRPALLNYGPNLGVFASGHAGSSFEGLWLSGVLEALKAPGCPVYGADADHMQVKRDPAGLDRALRVLESVRHYTFYTMDVSDVLDYDALGAEPADAALLLDRVGGSRDRRALLAFHREFGRRIGAAKPLDEVALGCYVGKYWDALQAMGTMTEHIRQLRDDQPFDLEFAVDETPPGVTACDSITSTEELIFIIGECQRRGLPVTHVAPNFGIEKEVDYRCPDGLSGLGDRVRDQTQVARACGLMVDYHSGDDLSKQTRQTIGRASEGYNQFKVSPYVQVLFAEVLDDVQPELFRIWWDDTLDFARREAAKGSPVAVDGLRTLQASDDSSPSARQPVFRHYCFASVGRRDDQGQYVHRETLYGELSRAFHQEYERRLVAYLTELAGDLLEIA
ncbi:MAG: hypothetical protein GX620_16375 [Chloroflexi bacterium]|nr:hypothetical protein [Chloroflexota bacterium]